MEKNTRKFSIAQHWKDVQELGDLNVQGMTDKQIQEARAAFFLGARFILAHTMNPERLPAGRLSAHFGLMMGEVDRFVKMREEGVPTESPLGKVLNLKPKTDEQDN